MVGGWSRWSRCSSTCGIGTQNHARKVLVVAAHGGKACPATVETKKCLIKECEKGATFWAKEELGWRNEFHQQKNVRGSCVNELLSRNCFTLAASKCLNCAKELLGVLGLCEQQPTSYFCRWAANRYADPTHAPTPAPTTRPTQSEVQAILSKYTNTKTDWKSLEPRKSKRQMRIGAFREGGWRSAFNKQKDIAGSCVNWLLAGRCLGLTKKKCKNSMSCCILSGLFFKFSLGMYCANSHLAPASCKAASTDFYCGWAAGGYKIPKPPPTHGPTDAPTHVPSLAPTFDDVQSALHSNAESMWSKFRPRSHFPTSAPSFTPSLNPTLKPSMKPSVIPTFYSVPIHGETQYDLLLDLVHTTGNSINLCVIPRFSFPL